MIMIYFQFAAKKILFSIPFSDYHWLHFSSVAPNELLIVLSLELPDAQVQEI